MKFNPLPLDGAFLIEIEPLIDERGFFARSFCQDEFKKNGLKTDFKQSNISFNHKQGTLRGMHFQVGDQEEAKIVRCTKGEIFDVIIDLRKKSKTYTQHFSITLSSKKTSMLYIPEGFAHGFITLEDNTEVMYDMSHVFSPEYARGIRWNDPTFNIAWPFIKPSLLSEKDQTYPDFNP